MNCTLFDTRMKFGTLKVVTNKRFFRYGAKPEKMQFPRKVSFIKINEYENQGRRVVNCSGGSRLTNKIETPSNTSC